jgi:CheY-like chemotaxis protein
MPRNCQVRSQDAKAVPIIEGNRDYLGFFAMLNNEALPETFIEQVKEALEKLYDFQALQKNELVQKIASKLTDSHTTGTHQLRGQIIDAIESLNPGENVTAQSGASRIYSLIYMHYVGRLTIQQAAWEIGVSLRQAYRDLRRGQEQVSAVLWDKLSTDTPASPEQSNSAQEELSLLEDNTTVTSLQALLETTMRPIHFLAEKYQIAIEIDSPKTPIMLTINHIIAQQTLTHILSQIIQQLKPAKLHIKLCDESRFISFQYQGASQLDLHIEPTIQQMMEQIRWELQAYKDEEIQEIGLVSSQRRALVVVIDDNEGSFHLLQRHLTDDAYSVSSVPNTEHGLRMIQQLMPDVIILDVMMPGIDGWELLQRLRAKKETQAIPVIICSVINDPELAYVLGASHYVPKPVSRESLLRALQALQI